MIELLPTDRGKIACSSCMAWTDEARKLSIGDEHTRQVVRLCVGCLEALRKVLGKASVNDYGYTVALAGDSPVDVDDEVRGLRELQANLTGRDGTHGAR